jgi:hypothetical protein
MIELCEGKCIKKMLEKLFVVKLILRNSYIFRPTNDQMNAFVNLKVE